MKEHPVSITLRVEVNGELIAKSSAALQLDEDGSPTRYYFPRADIAMSKLEPTQTTSSCPFKGKARYFNVSAGGQTLQDAAWSYEDPYEEHAAIKDYVAFYDDKYRQIAVVALA